jgi:2-oxoisovalerate dehydrogenase E1 component
MQPTSIVERSLRANTLAAGMASAFLIREVEQRLLALFAAGKLSGTVHTCIGQEWTGVAVAGALEPGDLLFSNHRCHGHFLARTGNVTGLIAEMMGRRSGVCGGLGGSQHLCDAKTGFYSNGIQGGMMPVAAGMALALKLRKQPKIAAIFIGDGTLGQGAVYETLNLASKWRLPLLVVLENNRYAQSTAQQETLAGGIRERAASFGIESFQSATWDPDTLCAVARQCADSVRREQCPALLEIECDRLLAHSKGDDDRDAAEMDLCWERDPITAFKRQHPAESSGFEQQAAAIVDLAVSEAEAAPYAELYLPAGARETQPREALEWTAAQDRGGERIAVRIREGLLQNMRRDPRIVLLGEDIRSPYGGAFKVTKGLSDEFSERVLNTPISESALVGAGTGLALGGFLPVCEIMFGDFLTLAADQIVNHAAKFELMYNGQVRVPLVIRTPMGGRRGYGPTHSQSLEKHWLGIANTQVLALHDRYDPALVYDQLFSTSASPALVIENKRLYASRLSSQAPAGFVQEHTVESFPVTRIRPLAPPDVTVFCYGGMLPYAVEAAIDAFVEEEIPVEVICPLRIYPLDPRAVIESLGRTHLLVIAEEGAGFAGAGAELLAQLAEHDPSLLRRVKRVCAPAAAIPACGPLEERILPSSGAIQDAIRSVMHHA